MKLVAETTGNFMLWGGVKNETVEPGQVNVVSADGFWDSKINVGQLTVHGRVKDSATNEMLQEVLKKAGEKKRQSAIEGFCKEHKFDPNEPVADEAPTPEQQLVDAQNKLNEMLGENSKATAEELAHQEDLVATLKAELAAASK